jgi:DNA repair exonuclease SbcCD ATPase subunit
MADSPEVEKLKARIEELEQQLAEERDEFEWDLKAAKESSDQTIRKLEGELERLRQAGAGGSASAKQPEDVKMLTQRALMAERRVAELQEELKRASQLAPPPPPKGDPLLRQRAEAAERERDELRKEKRALERSLEEKKSSFERLKKEQEESRGLKRQLESAKKDLVDLERELRKARDAASGQGDLSSALEKKETV